MNDGDVVNDVVFRVVLPVLADMGCCVAAVWVLGVVAIIMATTHVIKNLQLIVRKL